MFSLKNPTFLELNNSSTRKISAAELDTLWLVSPHLLKQEKVRR